MSRQEALAQQQVFISCVVPVFNEASLIEAFVQKLIAYMQKLTQRFEIILIDDGSTDGSSEVIANKLLSDQVKWIQFSRNFGKENALTAGLKHAHGDVVLMLDADSQHPLEVIPQFLEHWSQGYDMVYGVRENRDDEGLIKRITTRLFYRLMSQVSNIHIPADAGDFRLIDRTIVKALNRFNEHSRFMKGLYAYVGFKTIGIPYHVEKRAGGKSSFHLRKLLSLAFTGIVSFSDLPLRMWSLIGVLISSASLLYALWVIFSTFYYGQSVAGYPTIIVCVLFFGGIQLISIGVLGEYIARIFNEVKGRPLYLVARSHGITELQD